MATMATGNVTGGVKKSSGVLVQASVKEAWNSRIRNGEGDEGGGRGDGGVEPAIRLVRMLQRIRVDEWEGVCSTQGLEHRISDRRGGG